MPLDKDGNPRTDISFGEADDFLDWIQHDVVPHVEKSLFPTRNLNNGRKALFGHSYGGIFTLNTLYTKPFLFDTYIAASPITWWNKDFLINTLEPKFRDREDSLTPPVSLILAWGGCKSDMVQHNGESDAVYQTRLKCAEPDQMKECSEALAARMRGCSHVRSVQTRSFDHEDHGSAAVAGLQHGMTSFILDVN